jgi:hypothetical protein
MTSVWHKQFKRSAIVIAAALLLTRTCAAQEIRIGVLGLFHPTEIVLMQHDKEVLSVHSKQDEATPSMVLNGEPGHRRIAFRLQGNLVSAGENASTQWIVTARDGGPVQFEIEVPGKLQRHYRGKLILLPHRNQIDLLIAMDRETVVASIVAAEMEENAPLEALKAQAVVTRSFLAAGPHHLDFDFCDTTHCQFLKSPPPAVSQIWGAVEATRGMVLSFHGHLLAALYSSRCGGKTRSLHDAGLDKGDENDDAYPYYSVQCAWCHRNPLVWRRHLNQNQHLPQPGDERQRIVGVRQWGWSALPGNDYTVAADGSGWMIEGHNLGHGVGMCQHGAMGMAASGAEFRKILAHYYPNTSLQQL